MAKKKLKKKIKKKFVEDSKNEQITEKPNESCEYEEELSNKSIKSFDEKTLNSTVYIFLTYNKEYLEPILHINNIKSFAVNCSANERYTKRKINIVKDIVYKINDFLTRKKAPFLFWYKDKPIKEKWKIMELDGIKPYIERQNKNLKSYKKRYEDDLVSDNNYSSCIEKMNLICNNNWFWYIYILPKAILIIFRTKLYEDDEQWNLYFLSDLLKYFLDISFVGIMKYFEIKN